MTSEHTEFSSAHATPPERGSDRSFGIMFAAVFCLIGWFPFFTAGHIRVWALMLSGAFLFVTTARPRLLKSLNRMWTRVGELLNRIVSPVALLAIYCVAIVPTALALRLVHKDLLRLGTDGEANSYWITRTPPGRPDAHMKKQF